MSGKPLIRACCAASVFAAVYPHAACGQVYPVKPIRLVSPYTAAGVNDIIAKLNSEIARLVRVPEIIRQFNAQGVEPTSSAPEEFAAIIRADFAKWGKVVREAGIRGE